MTRPQLDLRAVTARRRSALRATEVRMYPRSGPRTDGRCAGGPRVEWFDGEARPTDDPASSAERPVLTTPHQLFPKPYLVRRFLVAAILWARGALGDDYPVAEGFDQRVAQRFEEEDVVDGRVCAGHPDAQAKHDGNRAVRARQTFLDQVRPRTPAAEPRVELARRARAGRIELDHRLIQPIRQICPDIRARVCRSQPEIVRRERLRAVEDANLHELGIRLTLDVALDIRDDDAKNVGANANAMIDRRPGQIGQRRRPRTALGR